jgi:pyruvate,water dikinase
LVWFGLARVIAKCSLCRDGKGGNAMSYVRWFDEVGAADVELVGGKGANLGEVAGAGLPVPPGFSLTAAAYRESAQATQCKALPLAAPL